MSKINLEPKWIHEVTKIETSLWSTGLIGGSPGTWTPFSLATLSHKLE